MTFQPAKFIIKASEEIKDTVRGEKAIVALSGGVDSFTVAALAAKTIPDQLNAYFVDTGLMRTGEKEQVEKAAGIAGINIETVNASEKFFSVLKGITDPEEKRKKIGELFIRIFEQEARKHNAVFLLQGTIAPDWIESGGHGRARIKSHHNVAGLPDDMKLKLCEPLREIYKHEVREVAKELGLPGYIYNRQPFPGPALAVRIIGEVTQQKVAILQHASKIVEEEIEEAVNRGKIEKPWQYFAALLSSKSVGVRGDERAYQHILVVRAVQSRDGMTARFFSMPNELFQKISSRITNEVHEICRVLYDITNKPPGTIEFE